MPGVWRRNWRGIGRRILRVWRKTVLPDGPAPTPAGKDRPPGTPAARGAGVRTPFYRFAWPSRWSGMGFLGEGLLDFY